VSFTVNIQQLQITMTQTGENPSSVNGRLLRKGEIIALSHGDTIELVHGMYKYMVAFEPPPKETISKVPKIKELKLGEPATKRQRLDIGLSSSAVSENKWETIDNGKVLVFTAKGTENSSKVL
jgi:hypothetical protein